MSNTNNTQQTDIEAALQWWKDLEYWTAIRLLLNAKPKSPFPVKNEEILEIWRKETLPNIEDTLTDRLLDNPMQEEEDYRDFIDAAYPSTSADNGGELQASEGDWILVSNNIIASGRKEICQLSAFRSIEENEANSNLILASKDLYNTLKALVDNYNNPDISDFNKGARILGENMKTAMKSLQKANKNYKP